MSQIGLTLQVLTVHDQWRCERRNADRQQLTSNRRIFSSRAERESGAISRREIRVESKSRAAISMRRCCNLILSLVLASSSFPLCWPSPPSPSPPPVALDIAVFLTIGSQKAKHGSFCSRRASISPKRELKLDGGWKGGSTASVNGLGYHK